LSKTRVRIQRTKRNTHIDLALLGNAGPILGRDAAPPVKLEPDGDRRLVVGHPEAGEVLARLCRREGEVPRLHVLRVVHAVPVRRRHLQRHQSEPNASISTHTHRHGLRDPNHAYPEEDAVRFGELGIGEVGVRADDVVLADCHGVDLDLVGDALGVAGLEVEPEGASRRLGRKEEGGQEEQRGRGQPLGGQRIRGAARPSPQIGGGGEVTGAASRVWLVPIGNVVTGETVRSSGSGSTAFGR
jgi:hypothetical protein